MNYVTEKMVSGRLFMSPVVQMTDVCYGLSILSSVSPNTLGFETAEPIIS